MRHVRKRFYTQFPIRKQQTSSEIDHKNHSVTADTVRLDVLYGILVNVNPEHPHVMGYISSRPDRVLWTRPIDLICYVTTTLPNQRMPRCLKHDTCYATVLYGTTPFQTEYVSKARTITLSYLSAFFFFIASFYNR